MTCFREIALSYRLIYEHAVDPDTGEVTSDDDLVRALDGIGDALNAKTEAVAMLRFQALDEAEVIKAEMARLQKHLSRRTALAERLKVYTLQSLQLAKVREVKSPLVTVRLRKVPAPVLVLDLEQLPEAFVKVERSAKRSEIKAALAAGDVVPGAELGPEGETVVFQ